MHELYLTSMRDTLLVGIPFIVIVALAIFRLDAIFASSKGSAQTQNLRRPGCGMDKNGEPVVVDPDGRPSGMRTRRK